MRFIRKGAAPRCLGVAQRTAKAEGGRPAPDDWKLLPGDCAAKVRRALWRDQSGLCAYCGVVIHRDGRDVPAASERAPAAGGMKIEHRLARSTHPEATLSWSNLLGVCVGSTVPKAQRHCDAARGAEPLHLNPTRLPDLVDRFRYDALGRVRPADPDDAAAAADIETLALNAGRLMANRATVIRALQAQLRQDDSVASLRRLLSEATTPDEDGRLPTFAPVAESYLRQKLRSRGQAP
ncbi:MAG: retron system putative HNH endonuclease [bacterium]